MIWLCLLLLAVWTTVASGMTDEAIGNLRQETRDIFYHGYDNYMRHAFPEDELRPLSCAPLTRDRENPAHIEVNDVLGNYSLTLIDSLSTLAILASSPPTKRGYNKALEEFQQGISLLVDNYGDGTEGPAGHGSRARGFDLDSKVQVFETVIRGVGGLLSAHLFAVGDLPIRGYEPREVTKRGKTGILWRNGFLYNGQLLRLAADLGERLLPAFYTPTGLPYPRVNLRHGIPFYANSPYNTDAEHGQCKKSPNGNVEVTETCSAGAGSLVLEFTTLSRLTGDGRFEKAAKEAFWAVWDRRSSSGLIGAGIDAETGNWVSPYTGIGAGIDSFFEYAVKSYILLSGLPFDADQSNVHSPEAFLDAWNEAHAGIKRHIYRGSMYQHPHYVQVDLYTGAMRAFWIDSLSAYYQGLLTLVGELDEAIETHLLYTALWTRYSAMPERWSTASGNIENGLRWWGGRPEFIESTWYLYRATQDPWYLHVGEMTLRDIKRRCWTRCGWSGLQDVRTGEQSDRMESFFLGETAKYLFLLFDPTHPLNTLDAPFVFTTEGHPLIIPNRLRPSQSVRRKSASFTNQESRVQPVCPLPPPTVPFSISATAARNDVFHAASLARLHLMPSVETLESPLVEFNHDHPSISISDIQSPSNYTYYPWTLPPELVPFNGTSSKMAVRTTFDLSFPNLPNSVLNMGALQRVNDGVLVQSMSGLRLGMIREPETYISDNGMSFEDKFRVYAISNVALGRDEKVFMTRDIIESFNPVDPFFTRTRDAATLDLVIDAPLSPTPSSSFEFDSEGLDEYDSDSLQESITSTLSNTSLNTANLLSDFDLELDLPASAADDPSYVRSLLQSIQSILSSPTAPLTPPSPPPVKRQHISGTIPSGPGAAPLPDKPDAELSFSDDAPLAWHNIHVHTTPLCTDRLPFDVARSTQILVVPRGGCSFSAKLRNIPAFPPDTNALQLVIVVSYPEHDEPPNDNEPEPTMRQQRRNIVKEQQRINPLVQPLLEEPQYTPSGLLRPNPIPMIMVGGGERTLALLRRAKGVGVRRRYYFLSQGVRIGNLIVL
ncbi:seven-hairpin glycosidase [Mytilinidion resinicola]|uniref:alpha-1,2-Mannosidase n=1 Tax=Mytilinidion resinicola TaxID=574789 RepID=A0A6A6XYN3_9PEZI|nr:seven-hairpin glycosidase [Mytilinidion resinicola]KAF2801661.1 seven-hairpin glycosidase [Mytilinidion resinicola]